MEGKTEAAEDDDNDDDDDDDFLHYTLKDIYERLREIEGGVSLRASLCFVRALIRFVLFLFARSAQSRSARVGHSGRSAV